MKPHTRVITRALQVLGCFMLLVPLLFILTAFLGPVSADEFTCPSPESWRILDRNGVLLREQVGQSGQRARYQALEAFSPQLLEATLAVEDRNFRLHNGVDTLSLIRALGQNILGRTIISGGSTITMQTVRLTLNLDHSLWAKFVQIWQALRIERVLSKDQILERYLNLCPYGQGTIGAEAASQRFFGKPASMLGLSESAFLAGIPQAPSLYNPLQNYNRTIDRWKQVLTAMVENGTAQDLIDRALSVPPQVRDRVSEPEAGHFSDWVLSFNLAPGDIRTSLDRDLNSSLETLCQNHTDLLSDRGLSNAAAIVLDNQSGQVIAMVGSRNWKGEQDGAVNGALAPRQPGSTLKPFAYGLALEKGVPSWALLADIETEYLGADHTLYIPQNYSRTYRGPVLLPEALVMSLNVPAIRLISENVGLGSFLTRLRALGFAGLDREADYYGLGLVLGNGEVSLLELASAYACLARGGIRLDPWPLLDPRPDTGKRIMPQNIAGLLTAMLSDEKLRTQAFGVDNPLSFNWPVAIKTGTSSQWRDTWCAGYTPEVTVVVWNGNFDGTPMDELSSVAGAGTLFAQIMDLIYQSGYSKGTNFSLPDDLRWIPVCAWSGKSPGVNCTKTTIVPSLDSQAPPPCDVHQKVVVDTRTGTIAGPSTPPGMRSVRTFLTLAPEFDQWMEQNHIPRPPLGNNTTMAGLRITRPRQGDIYVYEPGYSDSTQTLELTALASGRPELVEWLLDGKILARTAWPYAFNWPITRGKHSLQVRTGDLVSEELEFLVK